MQFLEDDINGHQEMFASLNENGQQIMAEMEPGDVLTAVQAKLDDMNDRCQSYALYSSSTEISFTVNAFWCFFLIFAMS